LRERRQQFHQENKIQDISQSTVKISSSRRATRLFEAKYTTSDTSCKFENFDEVYMLSRQEGTKLYTQPYPSHRFAMSDPSPPSTAPSLTEAHKTIFAEGLKIRYEVAGKTYVDKSLANGSSDFARPMQELVTEACWGSVWARPGLEKKVRSLLNISMLCALNRGPELAVHVRGALNNGATEVEIREVLLQVAIYCGMPAGLEGFKIAEKTILEVKKERGE
jgi:4-carboxymuconolactone decarboxylase